MDRAATRGYTPRMRRLRSLVLGPPPRASSSYQPVTHLANGGVGRVDLVVRREGSFERLYALKRLHAQHREDADFRTMFFDEARIAGLVRHPNVVSVLDVGEDAEGPFLVMDYIEGVALSAIIQRARASKTQVPMQLALRIGIEAALGLHAAHELVSADGEALALVHRDVSPQNILVGFDGVTRVTDFGVAKAFGRSTHTQTGVLKGKFGYMAPEQLRFEEVDRRADLFALGIVIFEMLAGQRLYRNVDGHDGIRRILHDPPPDLGDVRSDAAPELVELVFSMLAKDPALRPKTALEVARVLEEVLADTVATEGRLDVAEHLREVFADDIEVSRARARVVPIATKRAHSRARGAALVAGLLASVIAGAWAWASTSSGDPVEPGAALDAIAAAPTAEAATVEREAHDEDLPAEPTAHDHARAEAAAPSETAEPDEPAEARGERTRQERRGRASRRAARPASTARAGVPVWDWQ